MYFWAKPYLDCLLMTNPTHDSNPELSIVILCYRSEESIIRFFEQVRDLVEQVTSDYEIVLVGNYQEGSADKTKEIVEKIAASEPKVVAITRVKKGMMGWDMRMGMEKTRGNYICVIDGDGQFPMDSIRRCYEEIKLDKYDLVKTYRDKRHDGFYRNLVSKTYNVLFSVLFPNLRSKDINSKPKILTRSVYEQLNLTSNDWFIDAEIMINIRRKKLLVFEFPIEFHKLEGRASFVKFPAMLEFMKNLVIYRIKEFGKRKRHR